MTWNTFSLTQTIGIWDYIWINETWLFYSVLRNCIEIITINVQYDQPWMPNRHPEVLSLAKRCLALSSKLLLHLSHLVVDLLGGLVLCGSLLLGLDVLHLVLTGWRCFVFTSSVLGWRLLFSFSRSCFLGIRSLFCRFFDISIDHNRSRGRRTIVNPGDEVSGKCLVDRDEYEDAFAHSSSSLTSLAFHTRKVPSLEPV